MFNALQWWKQFGFYSKLLLFWPWHLPWLHVLVFICISICFPFLCLCVLSLKLLPFLSFQYMHVVRTTKTVICDKRFCTHTHIQTYTQTHTSIYQRSEKFQQANRGEPENWNFQIYCSIHGCWLSAIISHNTSDDYNIRKCVYYPEIITMKFMGQTKEWMQTVTLGEYENTHGRKRRTHCLAWILEACLYVCILCAIFVVIRWHKQK